MNYLEVEHLQKHFGEVQVLKDISFSVKPGEVLSIIGPSGSGKSTLLRIMTGVYRQDAGGLTYDGMPVYENPIIKKDIMYVPDELYFLPGANLNRMAKLYAAVYPGFDMKKFTGLAENLRLDRKKNIATFSKGMKRQAAIMLALSCCPKYMFFDETFDGLDPVMRNLIKAIICQEVEDRHAVAVITSHSLRELEDTCDQLALLHRGGLVLESELIDLKTNMFKVQTAFLDEYDRGRFEGINILHFAKRGSVSNIIVRGDREEIIARFNALHPVILDILPLTLEEVFTYEVEALGYDFSAMFDKEGEQG